jgi:NADP-dependent 3-hydroxy acid dehydrogenase YdfG
MDNINEVFAQLHDTNVTKTVHRQLYPTISPKRPELNQAGKVVLIPGGGTGVGYGIARSFVQASADIVILIGRRFNILEDAAANLEAEAQKANTNTKIIKHACDVTNIDETKAFWDSLTAKGIFVDVLIANVAKASEPKSILELGADEVWSQFEVNVKSHLYFTEQFYSQPSEKKKVGKELFIIHSSGTSIKILVFF